MISKADIIKEIGALRKVRLKGHHLSILSQIYLRFLNEGTFSTLPASAKINGESLTFAGECLCKRMAENPEFKVELVQGLDFLCSFCDKDRYDSCKKSNYSGEDSQILRAYCLETGREYAASEILNRAVKYKQETNFDSPRVKMLWDRGIEYLESEK